MTLVTLPMAGEDEPVEVLAEGTRVRDKRHPELTGRVRHEWNEAGTLSAIPYNVEWDDSSRAADVLGWFFVYAGRDQVEPLP